MSTRWSNHPQTAGSLGACGGQPNFLRWHVNVRLYQIDPEVQFDGFPLPISLNPLLETTPHEDLGIEEALTLALQTSRFVESLTISEFVKLVADTQLTVAEQIALTEALETSLPTMVNRTLAAEVLTVSEYIRAVFSASVQANENITITEFVSALLLIVLPLVASENITITESVETRLTPLVIRVHETIAISEYVLADAVGKEVHERIRITEYIRIAVDALAVQVHESIAITEGALNAGTLGGVTVVGPNPAPVPPTTNPPGNSGLVDYWTVGI